MTAADPPGTGVRLERSDAVATIVIEGARGALDAGAKASLRTALERLGEDAAVRAVVVTGVGATFCVGQDLRAHARALDDDATAAWETLREHYNPIVTALATMPKPVIAAVNGSAAGAGAAFALACDLRVVAETATFHLAFSGVGLSLDSGMSWTLPRLVGYGRAMELMLRPHPISAAQAVSIGLAHEVVPPDQLATRAGELAAELAAGPTIAYGAAKQALAYSAGHGLLDALDMEAALQTVAGTTQDHVDAVRAFLAKRAPVFRGA